MCKEVSNIFNIYTPRTSKKNKAKLIVKYIIDGEGGRLVIVDLIFLRRISFGLDKGNFPAWKILRGLDMDDHTSNFGALETLRGVQGSGYCESGVFQSKSTMSRKYLKLEEHATKCCTYKTYTSETGHISIAFKYENLVRHALVSLDLLKKLNYWCFVGCFLS